MKLRLAAVCAASCFAIAAPAFAMAPITATLAAPAGSTCQPIAGGLTWHCAQSACVSDDAEVANMAVSTCKQLARHVGRITAFTAGARSLTADQLSECNSVVH